MFYALRYVFPHLNIQQIKFLFPLKQNKLRTQNLIMNFFSLISRLDFAIQNCLVALRFQQTQFLTLFFEIFQLQFLFVFNLIKPFLLLILDFWDFFKFCFCQFYETIRLFLISVKFFDSISHYLLSKFKLSFSHWLLINMFYTTLWRCIPVFNSRYEKDVSWFWIRDDSSLLEFKFSRTFVWFISFL